MVVTKRKQPKSKSNQVTKHKQVRKSTVSKAKTRSSLTLSTKCTSKSKRECIQLDSDDSKDGDLIQDVQHGDNSTNSFETPVIDEENNFINVSNDVSVTTLYCYSDCPHGRLYDRSMIQCSHCMSWLHTSCTDAGSKPPTIWVCNKCRYLPESVSDIKNQLSEIHEILSVMVKSQNQMENTLCDLISKNGKLESTVKQLKEENHMLRMRCYNRLSALDSDSSEDDSSCPEYSSNTDCELQIKSPITTVKPKVKRRKRKASRTINKEDGMILNSKVPPANQNPW